MAMFLLPRGIRELYGAITLVLLILLAAPMFVIRHPDRGTT